MKLVTTTEMRQLEQGAVDAGATWAGLMEHAGWGVVQEATRLLGAAPTKQVLVLVGPGNNGGDGLVAARHLHDAGAQVVLYLWRRAEPAGDRNWQLCRQRGIAEYDAAADPHATRLAALLDEADLAIDALLGMGLSRPVVGALATIVGALNRARHAARPGQPLAVLAVDLPTGLDSDTGAALGVAVQADLTVATGQIKRGLLHYPARSYAGSIRLAEIGLSPTQLETLMSELLTAELARQLLPARPADAHKGTFGKVMVVAGSLLYPGAASLASAGAARVGAGLVTLATGRSALGGPGRLPEVTLRPLPESGWGILSSEAADEVLKHLDGYRALLVGPGLGREKESHGFIERLLGIEQPRQRGHIGFRVGSAPEKSHEQERPELPPTVIDADGLNLLSEIDDWSERLPRERCILTPHPTEMARLLKQEQLTGDPATLAAEAAARWGQVVVLKNATTVIAAPDGRTRLNDGGNPALATAGTGDVLAGAIAGLLAQGLNLFDAATLGVYLHSAAGGLVRDELGDAGAIASDLLPRLPLAIKRLR